MITVVGVAGRSEQQRLLDEFPSASFVSRSSKFTLNLPVDVSYDERFETSELISLPQEIARDLLSRGVDNEIVYIVPGRGDTGDSTVEALALLSDVRIYPNTAPLPSVGQLQIIDAVEIASAEKQIPFDTGTLAIDPGIPLLVTNWTGSRVPELASKRLNRLYGPGWIGERQNGAELFVLPLESGRPSASASQLASLASFLRTPTGCPWDREQTVNSLLPALLEEVSEFEESVHEDDPRHQADELGDVLMNLMMIAQVSHEQEQYSLDDVIFGISEKIIRRHPHVFGDDQSASVEDVRAIWQRVKHEEQKRNSRTKKGG